jgi:hypothetical protein
MVYESKDMTVYQYMCRAPKNVNNALSTEQLYLKLPETNSVLLEPSQFNSVHIMKQGTTLPFRHTVLVCRQQL